MRLNSRFSEFPNLPAEVVFQPLLRSLPISRVIGLCFKRGWSRQKAKTRGYKSHEGRRTQFCPQDTRNYSSTNQTYCPIGSVMTQSRLVTHDWSSIAPNWVRPVSLVTQHPKLQLLWRNLILFTSFAYSNSLHDTIKELMSYPKCRSVKVINNPVRPGSIHREVNYINYK
jgi:hypothetical protein